MTDALSLIATYAFTDTEITKDTLGNEGNRLPPVPRHAGSLWAKYQVLPERLEVGAGVFAVGQREGDNENTVQLPGYVRVDAFAAYHWKIGPSRLTAQINVNNLLDKEYFEASNVFAGNPRAGILPGDPLTVLGSLRLEY